MSHLSRWRSLPAATGRLCQALVAGAVLSAAVLAQAPPTYSIVNDRPGTFTDISATGTPLVKYPDTWTPDPNDVTLLAPDDWSIPFLSGVTNALVITPDLIASTNGAIGASTFGQFFDGTQLPTGAYGNYSQWMGLFPLWQDLVVDEQATLVHQLVQENGVDVEIVQWTNVRTYADWVANTGTRGSFQIKIFAAGPVLAQFLYQDVGFASGGSQAVIGAQWDYWAAVQYSAYQTDAVTNGTVLSVVQWHGIVPEFAVSTTQGATPLLVQFYDQSLSSEPAGTTTWAWDFDGDGLTDSTDQHPTWTYTTCGTYSVSLTVGDGINAPVTLTKPDLIVTDIITASFSWQALGGNAVRFTDTSSPPATAWAWDFDGDAVIDSTDQNPTWTFASSGLHNTTLAARRLCGPEATVVKQVASLERGVVTTLDGGYSFLTSTISDRPGCFFDLAVTSPIGVNMTGVAMSFLSYNATSTPIAVDVYLTTSPGGYLSNWANKANWRKVATGRGILPAYSNSQPALVNLTFEHPIWVPAGNQGMGLVMRRAGMTYYVMSTAGAGTYGNADVTLTMGGVMSNGFSGANPSQIWNGMLFYDLRGGPDDTTPPVANAGPDLTVIHANTTVALSGVGSTDETSSPDSLGFLWTLAARPAGSTSVITNPRSGPTGAGLRPDVWGTYRLTLVVTDEQGNASLPDEKVIFVPEDAIAPVANAGPDLSIHPGRSSILDARASSDNVTGASALVYLWTVVAKPVGSTVSIVNTTPTGTARVSVNMVGEYRLRLIVRDEQKNLSQPDEVVLSSLNQAPTADAGVDQIVVVNNWAYVVSVNSSDPDFDGIYYQWTILSAPVGSTAVLGYGGQYNSDYFVPDMRGTYVVQLIVHDLWGGYSQPDTVTLVAVLPGEMAAIRCKEAADMIAGYPASSFDAPGHQRSMCSQLRDFAKKLTDFVDHELERANDPSHPHEEDAAHERQDLLIKIDQLIERVDGWYNRNQADPKGQGQVYAADYILPVGDQIQVYWKLTEARSLIVQ